MSFLVEWQCLLGGEPGRVVQSSSSNGYDIDPLPRCDPTRICFCTT